MTYILKTPAGYVSHGRIVQKEAGATIYPHPSNAKRAAAKFPDAEIVPLGTVRRGAPKAIPGAKRTPIYLTPAQRKKAARIGGGNISEGLRLALDQHKEPTEAIKASRRDAVGIAVL